MFFSAGSPAPRSCSLAAPQWDGKILWVEIKAKRAKVEQNLVEQKLLASEASRGLPSLPPDTTQVFSHVQQSRARRASRCLPGPPRCCLRRRHRGAAAPCRGGSRCRRPPPAAAMQRAAVAFEDVAIYFSPEEWVELAAWQRELYQEVMMDNYDLVACLGSVDTSSKLVPKMEPEEEPCGGASPGDGDRETPDTAGIAPRGRTAGEDPPGDGDQGHWVPPVPLSGGAKELGCPPLCPGWCEAGTWGSPRRMGTWERGERPLEPAAPGGLLICGTCGENFEDAASLGAHQGEHLVPAPSHECTACGKVFQHHRNLLTHKKHRGRHRHACAECGCTFCLRGDLLRHRAVHAGEGSYPCALCSRRFRHKRDLQEHRREHAAAAPRQCPQCQKRFEDEASLSQHRASHVEERPFVCGRCGRSFSWKESLMIHQRSHAPERSHKCPVCGRSFSRSGNLLVHQRVHTGERPYACAQCDKTFCNKANLITHKKLHRRYKTFACAQCRLGFSSKSKLLLHLRAHGDGGAFGTGGDPVCGQP